MYNRVFHFYTLVQFRLALYVFWLQHSMLVTTKNFNVLIHVEVPVTGHGVFGRKLHWKCFNIYPLLISESKKRYMSVRHLVRKH